MIVWFDKNSQPCDKVVIASIPQNIGNPRFFCLMENNIKSFRNNPFFKVVACLRYPLRRTNCNKLCAFTLFFSLNLSVSNQCKSILSHPREDHKGLLGNPDNTSFHYNLAT